MEQSGVVGLTIEGQAERIVSFREASFCTQYVLAEIMGVEKITRREKGTDLFSAQTLKRWGVTFTKQHQRKGYC